MWQVLDIDVALESVMGVWFEQRQESKRQLTKTIETHRGIETGERLYFARSVCGVLAMTYTLLG